MFVREASDGNYYICRVRNASGGGRYRKGTVFRNWWLVKTDSKGSTGYIGIKQNKYLYTLTLPKQFIGKRVRLKVEVLE